MMASSNYTDNVFLGLYWYQGVANIVSPCATNSILQKNYTDTRKK